MKVIVNVGLLLEAIRRKGYRGFTDASAHCRVAPSNFKKLASGELPRLDALQRICAGLGITERDLILGVFKAKPEIAEVVPIKAAANESGKE